MAMRLPALASFALFFTTSAAAQAVHDRIYPAPKEPLSLVGLPARATLDSVTTSDGLMLKGIEVPPRDGKPVLLVFHGNGASAAGVIQWFAPLIAKGYGVLAAEYRGYSGNPGFADAAGLAADGEAFFARAQQIAAGARVLVAGHSLGGGVAFLSADNHKLDALITIGAFTRLRDMVSKLARAFVPDDYRNIDLVAKLDEPFFLIHGLRDDTVPPDQGNQLHIAATHAGKPGASFVLTEADHHPDGFTIATVIDAIDGWLTSGSFAPGFPANVHIFPFGAKAELPH